MYQSMTNDYKVSQQRILVVSPTPPPYSGPEIMTAHLLNSSLQDEYELIHFNISKNRRVATKAHFDFINIVFGILQPIYLLGLMIRHRPHLVYTNFAQNTGGFLRYASFILVLGLFPCKIVVRVMGDGFSHFYNNSGRILRLLISIVTGRIDKYIVRAELLKKQFVGIVPDEKLKVVYSGIDVDEFARHKKDARETDEHFTVLFVGYLTQAKGALDLLQIVPKIVHQNANIKFWMMGDRIDEEMNIKYINNPESNEDYLDKLLKQPDVESHVKLLGVQSGIEKVLSFVSADVFVLPSYSEAFPTVILEAMASSLPIVATRVGALPEVFDEKHILFVDAGDQVALAEAILLLANDKQKSDALGTANAIIAKEKFSLQAYAGQLTSLFQDVLQQKD